MNSNESASENVELYPMRYKSVREAPNGAGSCKLRNYVVPGGSGSIIYVEWGPNERKL